MGNLKLKTSAVDVIIPARNEAKTIGGVIDAFMLSTLIGKIIVVDDQSVDNTWETAKAHGAHVILKGCGEGKGQAVSVGLTYVDTKMVCLCDADMIGFTTEHAELLMNAMPQTMVIGVPEFTPNVPWAHKIKDTPLWGDLSGERCLPTGILYGIELHGYAMEVQINAAIARVHFPVVKHNLVGVKGAVKPSSYDQRISDYMRDYHWLKENGI